MAIRFFFNFLSSGHGRRETLEPVGFDGTDFSIEQEEGRLGRDVAFAGGKNQLRIPNVFKYPFEELLFNYNKYGFEAIVKFEIDFDEDTVIIGEVDFESAETDGVTYIEFTVIEESYKALLKARAEIKTNLLSNKDLDGDDIIPCTMKSVLLKAKPIIAVSEWLNPVLGQSFQFNPAAGADFINPVQQQEKYDIEDSLTWLENRDPDTGDNFRHVSAATNLQKIKVTVEHNVNWKYIPFDPASDRQGLVRIRVLWGQDNVDNAIIAGQYVTMYQQTIEGNFEQEITLPSFLETTIDFINATDIIWLYYTVGSLGSVQILTFQECKTTIVATSVAPNTVVNMIREIDAIDYVVKSSSKLNTISQRWNGGGEFYNQYVTSTPLMRGLVDKPFNVSFKDIVEEWLPECYGDYLLKDNGDVFIGRYPDFYRNYEIGNFQQQTIEGFKINFNLRYAINLFRYGYKAFASQKENEEANTYDLVHGETERKLPNYKANKYKEVKVGKIRDAFLIEQTRRKAYDLTDSAATQDDDKVFVLDVVPITEESRTFTETFLLRHEIGESGDLVLVNNQKFSWKLLGIVTGGQFSIDSGPNAGVYLVADVTDLRLRIYNDGSYTTITAQNTTFTYRIGLYVTLMNRTDEGFDAIENIEDGNNYSNLRFTLARSIRKYYNNYLATACLFKKDLPITNTVYKNNPEAYTELGRLSSLEDISVTEGEDFIPSNPLITPYLPTVNLIMSLQEWLNVQVLVRSENGYIRTFEADGTPLKGYIQKGTWKFLSKGSDSPADFLGIAECVLEEKYEPFIMTIQGQGDGLISINEEDFGANSFHFSIDAFEKLSIFDETGKLLFVPIPFDRVRVNNSGIAPSVAVLMNWLNNLM